MRVFLGKSFLKAKISQSIQLYFLQEGTKQSIDNLVILPHLNLSIQPLEFIKDSHVRLGFSAQPKRVHEEHNPEISSKKVKIEFHPDNDLNEKLHPSYLYCPPTVSDPQYTYKEETLGFLFQKFASQEKLMHGRIHGLNIDMSD